LAAIIMVIILTWGSYPQSAQAGLFGTFLAGSRPVTLGVHLGKLAPCPHSPNCVNSQADPTDLEHVIAPLRLGTIAPDRALAALAELIAQEDRTTIVQQTPEYLYTEFATPLLGFIDDVEVWLDRSTGTIQVRSASRLGESDLGLNRQRIESLRQKFDQAITRLTVADTVSDLLQSPRIESTPTPELP
jgi:uncharacterized protein (DUF1499 family)